MQTTPTPTLTRSQQMAISTITNELPILASVTDTRISDKQADLITKLADERAHVLPSDVVEQLRDRSIVGSPASFSRKQGSRIIDALITLPRPPKTYGPPKTYMKTSPVTPSPQSAAQSNWQAVEKMLENVPNARYAINPAQAPGVKYVLPNGTTTLFVQVTRYKGRTYVRQLHGGPGGFWRTPLNVNVALAVAAHLRDEAYTCAKRFSDVYAVCSRCAAELTVDRSRELGLGPTCAKSFGIAY